MSIFNSVSVTIKKYGCCITVLENGKNVNTKAFVEPLRYKNKVYIGGKYHRLGFVNTEKYLYVGPADFKLTENISVIQTHNCKYIVKRCETYYVKDRAVYVWAILLPYGGALEDDYESD